MPARTGSLYWLTEVTHRAFPSMAQKMTMLVLARYVDEDDCCYPSQVTLAAGVGVSERKMRAVLAELEEAGLLDRSPRWSEGHRASDVIRLGRDAVEALAEVIPADRAGSKPARTRVHTGTDASVVEPSPSLRNHLKTEPVRAARAEAEMQFAAHFWPIYPQRNGKRLNRGKALAHWVRLSIEDRRAARHGAIHYAAAAAAGLQLPKDPDRWLRDRCWEDWQEPAVADTRSERGDAAMATAQAMWSQFRQEEEGHGTV